MWANSACTERPVVGQTYQTLYVKLARAFGLNDYKEWGSSGNPGTELQVSCADDEYPTDPYSIALYVDYTSEIYNNPFEVGQIVQVTYDSPSAIDNTYVFDFYDE